MPDHLCSHKGSRGPRRGGLCSQADLDLNPVCCDPRLKPVCMVFVNQMKTGRDSGFPKCVPSPHHVPARSSLPPQRSRRHLLCSCTHGSCWCPVPCDPPQRGGRVRDSAATMTGSPWGPLQSHQSHVCTAVSSGTLSTSSSETLPPADAPAGQDLVLDWGPYPVAVQCGGS